jgi:hypothetical protein
MLCSFQLALRFFNLALPGSLHQGFAVFLLRLL